MKLISCKLDLWVKGMQLTHKTNEALNATKRLQACPDFRYEKGMVQTLVKKRGGGFLLTPKYHCELTGMGVEYSWCKEKQYFKTINDKIPRNLGGNVEKALDVAVLSLDFVLWYARRARAMMEVYRMLQASCCTEGRRFPTLRL